jgi:hypothetical protein
MASSPFSTPSEREQIAALRAHQKSVKGHKAAKTRVTSAAEALAIAEEDHRVAVAERAANKDALLAALADA